MNAYQFALHWKENRIM